MKRIAANVLVIALSLILASCGSGGSSADPPAAGINLLPGDGRITATWVAQPNVQYWLTYSTSASAVSSKSSNSFPGGGILMDVVSPLVVPGLVNGTAYYFTMDARVDGGPGGADTPVASATPRYAGVAPSTWNAGAALGANDLRGTSFGNALGIPLVAVGAAGAMYSSTDGIAWTPLSSVVASDLNAVLFNTSTYLAVGAGGVILSSIDGKTWLSVKSATTNTLNGLTSYGYGVFFAVGANGTIVTYANAATGGTLLTSGTSNNLNAITYAPGKLVAVGAGGVILASVDWVNWTAVTSGTTLDLTGVAYGAGQYVAVGAAGTVVTSADGVTWTVRPAITAKNLTAVTRGSQFVAVGSGGSLFTSPDGITWTAQASGTVNDLKAAASGSGGYSVVGAAGTNLTAY